MWFSALKLGLNAATHIYKKKQETKMKMADAQLAAADKMARGETEYQGKLLECHVNLDLEGFEDVGRIYEGRKGNYVTI